VRPAFHLVAGPNGAGKTTYYEHYLRDRTRAEFVNPDLLAKAALGRWSRTRPKIAARAPFADPSSHTGVRCGGSRHTAVIVMPASLETI
jgi:hypothetical protein